MKDTSAVVAHCAIVEGDFPGKNRFPRPLLGLGATYLGLVHTRFY